METNLRWHIACDKSVSPSRRENFSFSSFYLTLFERYLSYLRSAYVNAEWFWHVKSIMHRQFMTLYSWCNQERNNFFPNVKENQIIRRGQCFEFSFRVKKLVKSFLSGRICMRGIWNFHAKIWKSNTRNTSTFYFFQASIPRLALNICMKTPLHWSTTETIPM